ncbi:hypothetical protein LTR56_015433 [Elasticomyces elasticus]|nr:hypothetical protein LTR56_015433 [Elasticomyces elasticus]KAK3646016.1 hypothetical protein LTR22_014451 [Elasticomyces elasticus]KAK4912686.1 hypothetical protein LTR49_018859 [Elasticomyces elasticus]KAK5761802.1 hypothetical protein LTS12_008057 [Elasticomyces elasticus]
MAEPEPTAGRFSKFDLNDNRQWLALQQELLLLRTQISTGAEIPESEIADLTTALGDRQFYGAACLVFATLEGKRDVDKNIKDDLPVLLGMVQAAEKWMPPPIVPLRGGDFAVQIDRRALTVLGEFIGREYKDMEDDDRRKFAMGCVLFLELAGVGEIPLGLQQLAAQYNGSLPPGYKRAKPEFYHPDAVPEDLDGETQTGVYNGGNTCYQNGPYIVLSRSDGIAEQMRELGKSLVGHEVGETLFDLTTSIREKNFDFSRIHLQEVWQYFDELHARTKELREETARQLAVQAELAVTHGGPIPNFNFNIPDDPHAKFYVGSYEHQDAAEYLSSFLESQLGPYMAGAWGFEKTEVTECTVCEHKTEKILRGDIMYHLSLRSRETGSKPRDSVGLVQLLAEDMTTFSMLRKRCEQAQAGDEHEQWGATGPHHIRRTALRDSDEPKEKLIVLDRWKETFSGSREFEKDDTLVTFPEHAIPMPGDWRFYWLQDIIIHIGTYYCGHYVTVVRDEFDGKWYLLNDSARSEVTWKWVKKQRWYIARLVPFRGEQLLGLTIDIRQAYKPTNAFYPLLQPLRDGLREEYRAGRRAFEVLDVENRRLDTRLARLPMVPALGKVLQQICANLGYELVDMPSPDGDSDDAASLDEEESAAFQKKMAQVAMKVGAESWARIGGHALDETRAGAYKDEISDCALRLLAFAWQADPRLDDDFEEAAQRTIETALTGRHVARVLESVTRHIITLQAMELRDQARARALALPRSPPTPPLAPVEDGMDLDNGGGATNGNAPDPGVGDKGVAGDTTTTTTTGGSGTTIGPGGMIQPPPRKDDMEVDSATGTGAKGANDGGSKAGGGSGFGGGALGGGHISGPKAAGGGTGGGGHFAGGHIGGPKAPAGGNAPAPTTVIGKGGVISRPPRDDDTELDNAAGAGGKDTGKATAGAKVTADQDVDMQDTTQVAEQNAHKEKKIADDEAARIRKAHEDTAAEEPADELAKQGQKEMEGAADAEDAARRKAQTADQAKARLRAQQVIDDANKQRRTGPLAKQREVERLLEEAGRQQQDPPRPKLTTLADTLRRDREANEAKLFQAREATKRTMASRTHDGDDFVMSDGHDVQGGNVDLVNEATSGINATAADAGQPATQQGGRPAHEEQPEVLSAAPTIDRAPIHRLLAPLLRAEDHIDELMETGAQRAGAAEGIRQSRALIRAGLPAANAAIADVRPNIGPTDAAWFQDVERTLAELDAAAGASAAVDQGVTQQSNPPPGVSPEASTGDSPATTLTMHDRVPVNGPLATLMRARKRIRELEETGAQRPPAADETRRRWSEIRTVLPALTRAVADIRPRITTADEAAWLENVERTMAEAEASAPADGGASQETSERGNQQEAASEDGSTTPTQPGIQQVGRGDVSPAASAYVDRVPFQNQLTPLFDLDDRIQALRTGAQRSDTVDEIRRLQEDIRAGLPDAYVAVAEMRARVRTSADLTWFGDVERGMAEMDEETAIGLGLVTPGAGAHTGAGQETGERASQQAEQEASGLRRNEPAGDSPVAGTRGAMRRQDEVERAQRRNEETKKPMATPMPGNDVNMHESPFDNVDRTSAATRHNTAVATQSQQTAAASQSQQATALLAEVDRMVAQASQLGTQTQYTTVVAEAGAILDRLNAAWRNMRDNDRLQADLATGMATMNAIIRRGATNPITQAPAGTATINLDRAPINRRVATLTRVLDRIRELEATGEVAETLHYWAEVRAEIPSLNVEINNARPYTRTAEEQAWLEEAARAARLMREAHERQTMAPPAARLVQPGMFANQTEVPDSDAAIPSDNSLGLDFGGGPDLTLSPAPQNPYIRKRTNTAGTTATTGTTGQSASPPPMPTGPGRQLPHRQTSASAGTVRPRDGAFSPTEDRVTKVRATGDSPRLPLSSQRMQAPPDPAQPAQRPAPRPQMPSIQVHPAEPRSGSNSEVRPTAPTGDRAAAPAGASTPRLSQTTEGRSASGNLFDRLRTNRSTSRTSARPTPVTYASRRPTRADRDREAAEKKFYEETQQDGSTDQRPPQEDGAADQQRPVSGLRRFFHRNKANRTASTMSLQPQAEQHQQQAVRGASMSWLPFRGRNASSQQTPVQSAQPRPQQPPVRPAQPRSQQAPAEPREGVRSTSQNVTNLLNPGAGRATAGLTARTATSTTGATLQLPGVDSNTGRLPAVEEDSISGHAGRFEEDEDRLGD